MAEVKVKCPYCNTYEVVKGIANRYGKILICEPNDDGAKVNV